MNKHLLAFSIPPHISFSDLKLSREADGDVSFDLDVIKALCEANNISSDVFLNAPEDNLSTLLVNWYAEHINGVNLSLSCPFSFHRLQSGRCRYATYNPPRISL